MGVSKYDAELVLPCCRVRKYPSYKQCDADVMCFSALSILTSPATIAHLYRTVHCSLLGMKLCCWWSSSREWDGVHRGTFHVHELEFAEIESSRFGKCYDN